MQHLHKQPLTCQPSCCCFLCFIGSHVERLGFFPDVFSFFASGGLLNLCWPGVPGGQGHTCDHGCSRMLTSTQRGGGNCIPLSCNNLVMPSVVAAAWTHSRDHRAAHRWWERGGSACSTKGTARHFSAHRQRATSARGRYGFGPCMQLCACNMRIHCCCPLYRPPCIF